jgi:hypothetical protein
MRTAGLVGEELGAVLGVVVDDLHADQQFDLGIAP